MPTSARRERMRAALLAVCDPERVDVELVRRAVGDDARGERLAPDFRVFLIVDLLEPVRGVGGRGDELSIAVPEDEEDIVAGECVERRRVA